MEREVQGDAATLVDSAIEDLCQLIDAIDRTTDLLKRHCLFRRLHTAAEALGVLRTETTSFTD